ncbi:mannosyltransferase domain-containing protein [Capsaspora owczarzaki ATCC 30864]|uniref:mannosyltransferase domain-containing protein n=1 Tax=Capsaspora owczarzaki (strain ATCC 30864) TaxID=595528 RepID=UPI0001FE4F60|nr:mannosyltransferase domain-containing protein [Capsaspora owczarzaki ATCC 30864]|eukprot:XP_004346828.1 mannosyltransferase domain-containing protein [Capsaspora owczarzaki ATCC 30864]
MQPQFALLFAAALAVRLCLVVYGDWHDAHSQVKYTDVDYHVFTDAAQIVAHDGGSPYDRHTYRYTPLLAWMLVPNVLVHPAFGKMVFVVADLLAGWLIAAILALPQSPAAAVKASGRSTTTAATPRSPNSNDATGIPRRSLRKRTVKDGLGDDTSTKIDQFDNSGNLRSSKAETPAPTATQSSRIHYHWFLVGLYLLNPLPIAVSTRGNAEALLSVLVLACLYCASRKWHSTAAVLLGFAAHMKIFPIMYSLPLWLNVDGDSDTTFTTQAGYLDRIIQSVRRFFSLKRLWFGAIAAGTFLALGLWMWTIYGWPFLHETFLYHITRKDHRHNFSPYFYMLYLTNGESDVFARVVGLAAFLPQALLVGIVGVVFHRDLGFCCFLQTFLFVAFNKVCTSQYFVWYVCLLPLAVRSTNLTWKQGAGLFALWMAVQGLWLAPAYLLEFQSQNTFLWIWLAGLVMLAGNIAIARAFILARVV